MTEEAKTPHKPRTLYFAVRYNWETKEAKLVKYEESQDCKALYAEKLPEGVTLHRCEVELSPDPVTDVVAREIYVDSDYVPSFDISAFKVLQRANPHRLFPVLTGKNSINIRYNGLGSGPSDQSARSQSYTVAFNNRSFRVTVDELPLPEPFNILTHLSKRLDYIEKAPEMWGGLEAVELQYLGFLETYLLVCKGCPPDFVLTYSAHCKKHYPKLGSRPYSAVATSHQDLVAALKSFRASVAPVPV